MVYSQQLDQSYDNDHLSAEANHVITDNKCVSGTHCTLVCDEDEQTWLQDTRYAVNTYTYIYKIYSYNYFIDCV